MILLTSKIMMIVSLMFGLPFHPFGILMGNNVINLGEPVEKCLGTIFDLELLVLQDNAFLLHGVLWLV